MTSYASSPLPDHPLPDQPLRDHPLVDEPAHDATVTESEAIVARTDRRGERILGDEQPT